MKISKISKKEIFKTVLNSQLIEGYKPASKDVSKKVKEIMKKNNIQISSISNNG